MHRRSVTVKSGRRATGHKPLSVDKARCVRKANVFPSERVAAIRAQIRANEVGYPLAIYQCPECKRWHFTSQTRNTNNTVLKPQDAVTAAIFALIHG